MEQSNSIVGTMSALTAINKKTLNKLFGVMEYCVADSFYESMLGGSDVASIDVGIGTLLIKHSDSEIRYKFIPSQKLSDMVSSAVSDKANPLEKAAEERLVARMTDIYKDLI